MWAITSVRPTLSVTTCVVVWIEIMVVLTLLCPRTVTTCVVVWIEILIEHIRSESICVTTCVVVWIEIATCVMLLNPKSRHHLRGGVD